jgi:hypothetical protein
MTSKYTKLPQNIPNYLPQNIPNYLKIRQIANKKQFLFIPRPPKYVYQMASKYHELPQNIPNSHKHTNLIQDLQNIPKFGIFVLKYTLIFTQPLHLGLLQRNRLLNI